MFPDEPVLDAAAVVAEVRSAFEAYERAFIANDVAAMDAAFWNDARVVRFGIAEIQHGYADVAAWRATATPVPTSRVHERVVVTAFGANLAVVSLEFRNGVARTIGRQSQHRSVLSPACTSYDAAEARSGPGGSTPRERQSKSKYGTDRSGLRLVRRRDPGTPGDR